MVLHKIPAKFYHQEVPHYKDHHVFTQKLDAPFHLPTHITGLGLITTIEGKVNGFINDNPVSLDPQSFFIINRGSRFSLTAKTSGCTPFLLYFDSTSADLLMATLFYTKQLIHPDITPNLMKDFSLVEHYHFKNATLTGFITQLMDLANSCASFHSLKADMLIRHMLENLVHENYEAIGISSQIPVVKKSTKIALYQSLSMAKAWIDKNYKSNINSNQMADVAMLTNEHFLRLFQKAFDTTPRQYIIRLRIKEAKKLLRKTTLPIVEICEEVGFHSPSSFSLLFKKMTGQSPSTFRNTILNLRIDKK